MCIPLELKIYTFFSQILLYSSSPNRQIEDFKWGGVALKKYKMLYEQHASNGQRYLVGSQI